MPVLLQLRTLVVLLVLALPQASPQGIQDALRLQAKDPAAAARILEGVVEREPKNSRAWRLLASVLQQTGQLDRAIEAYQKAVTIQPDPAVMYSLGTAYAQKKDAERAFEWLGKARATGAVDMTQMQVDSNLAELREDPRSLSSSAGAP